MIRVVVDTNVYISALMFGGPPGSLLNLAFLLRSCLKLRKEHSFRIVIPCQQME